MSTEHDPHLGAFTSAEQKTRIANIHARMRTHYEAVRQAEADVGAEPELVEYAARWRAFMREMNDLGERAEAWWSWITDHELDMADARLNVLLAEWPGIESTINLRKNKPVLEILEKAAADKTPPKGPVDPSHKLTIPDVSVHLPDSAASHAPAPPTAPPPKAPPDPNVPIKVGVVGVLGLATVLSAATAKSDAARAGFAVGGGLLTLGVGAALFGLGFSDSTPATKKGA